MLRRRKFSFCSERLEDRRVLAGNVNVVLSGTTLKITGDDVANLLTIARIDADTLRITGNATNIQLNGGTGAGSQDVDIADFTKLAVKIDLLGGNDNVQIGDGGNSIEMKSLSVKTGAGADTASTIKCLVSGTSAASIQMFKAATEVENDIFVASVTTFKGGLKVRTGDGVDGVDVIGTSQVDKTLDIDTGKGNDHSQLMNCTLNSLKYNLGDGDDNAIVMNVQLNATKGTSRLKFGTGTDLVTLATVTAQHALQADLDTASGTAANQFFLINVTTPKGIKVNGGAGVDTISADTVTAASIDLLAKAGADIVTAKAVTAPNLKVDAGAGNDQVDAQTLNVATSLTVDGGADTDVLNFVLSNSTVPGGTTPKNFETQNIT